MNKIASQALYVNHMQKSPLERGLCFTECKLMRSVRSHPRVRTGKSSGSPSHGEANTMPVLTGYGAASGKQAGRRKERDGLPYKKSLEIRHFWVLRTRRRQSWHRSGAAEVARNGKDKGNGSNGGGWMYNRSCPEVKSKILVQELVFASRCHRPVLPPRGACKRPSALLARVHQEAAPGDEWPGGLATGMEVSFVSQRHSIPSVSLA